MKRKQSKEREAQSKKLKPEGPASGLKTGTQTGANLSFAQFISDTKINKETSQIAGKDPREALAKYRTDDGGSFINQAYDGKNVLAEKSLEEEEAEARKKE